MTKIYLIQHSFNKSCEPCGFFEIVSAHSTKKNAMESLEKINKSIEAGTSHYFPDTKMKGERMEKSWFDGYTYEWRDEAGKRMFTHFTIVETDFE